ncbi:HNH endonuclease [Myroides odoratus]
MNSKLWVLKTVHDQDKASITIDSYGDSLTEYYNYDNNVANSKQIETGDYAILIDKKKILGFSKIGYIDQYEGKKTVRKCPICGHSTLDKRKTKSPTYRCNKGHEFEHPIEEIQLVTKYSASFFSFVSTELYNDDLLQLKPYYSNGYNRNMSMQYLSLAALHLFANLKEQLDNAHKQTIQPTTSLLVETENPYYATSEDERDLLMQTIKARRGQQTFRKKLLEQFEATCVISGCKIIDILEAAHINPYRGEKDHHSGNGLLLRADIHTLFDLDLIRINSKSFKVEISNKLIGSEYEQYEGVSLKRYEHLISIEALKNKLLKK